MSHLTTRQYFATGTIRDNRTNMAKLLDVRIMKKQERGTLDYTYDKKNAIIIARWNDNSVVTVASNHETIEPLHRVKRWDRKNGKIKTIEMPQILKAYNQRMGGVDQFDNAINKYRIGIRGKKWYWPLFTNVLDAAMVNAWKLHCLLRNHESKLDAYRGNRNNVIPQFEFRIYVTECLLRQQKIPNSAKSTSIRKKLSMALNEVSRDNIGHLISRISNDRRCV